MFVWVVWAGSLLCLVEARLIEDGRSTSGGARAGFVYSVA